MAWELLGGCHNFHSSFDERSSQLKVLALISLLALSTSAAAAETPYCRKVTARAASDAALLLWPRLNIDGFRFPSTGQLDTVTTGPAGGYQLRAGLSYSAIDLVRGVQTLNVGRADCEQHEVGVSVQEVVAHGLDVARLAALRQQQAYLDEQRAHWQALLAKAEERLAAHAVTLVDVETVRGSAEELEHKWAQVQGEVQQLQARTRGLGDAPLDTLARNYVERAMRLEREVSRLRSLDAWQVRVSAGVVPLNGVDWYGMAELSVNLGVFMREHHERRYLDARRDELQKARYEVDTQIDDFRGQARAQLAQARQELVLVERELKLINDSRRALERSEAPGVAHARDALALHAFSLESDRAFLRGLVVPLSAFVENRHGQQ